MTSGENFEAFRRSIIRSARSKILFLSHAVRQMSHPDRMITAQDVRRVVQNGEIIENYPEDVRGHSCLLLGACADGRRIHVVCAPRAAYLAIITAYLPDAGEWDTDLRVRRRS